MTWTPRKLGPWHVTPDTFFSPFRYFSATLNTAGSLLPKAARVWPLAGARGIWLTAQMSSLPSSPGTLSIEFRRLEQKSLRNEVICPCYFLPVGNSREEPAPRVGRSLPKTLLASRSTTPSGAQGHSPRRKTETQRGWAAADVASPSWRYSPAWAGMPAPRRYRGRSLPWDDSVHGAAAIPYGPKSPYGRRV